MRARRMLHTIVGLLVLSMPLLTWLRLSGAFSHPSQFPIVHFLISILFSGCWLSDPLNNYFGRRGTIFTSALILIVTPIASGFTHSWQTLFVVRLILGIGMGVKGEQCPVTNIILPNYQSSSVASTVPMYAAENSPAKIRGALVMTWQLWVGTSIQWFSQIIDFDLY
jgi:MFS family permease